MEGGVQVTSREIVKPSSEIHPKQLKLSCLDQTSVRVYVPIIFFYQADESKGLTASNRVQISKQLKQSLCDTLTTFYPLAGRVEGDENTVVDCNDAGVEFIEARVHAQLKDALKGPDLEDYFKLKQYYYLPLGPATSERPFLFTQITFFDCGGIALGICFSHLLADCHSIMMFINAWASKCRSEKSCQMVSFDLANYFPPRELLPKQIDYSTSTSNKNLNIRTKMLLFDKEKIQLLKQDAISSMIKDPTRVEVISAFIWKFMLENCCTDTDKTKTFAALHAVNLRGRMKPLENIFGNCMMSTAAYADDGVIQIHALVAKLRRSIRKIDDDYITESQNGDTYLNDDGYKMLSGVIKMEGCVFSSWCRIPFYEVDYGFGRPMLFQPAIAAADISTIILVSNKSTGEDIEAWVSTEQHILVMLQNQINLISATAV